MTTHPRTPAPETLCNATSVFSGRDFIDTFETMGDPGLLHQKNTLAGWITLIADEHGLGADGLALAVGIDRELALAILGGTVMGVPLALLDRTLRALENRPH